MALRAAVADGDLGAVRGLLASSFWSGGADSGAVELLCLDAIIDEESKLSPLMLASRDGHLEIARLLLESGATVDLQNDWG